MSHFETIGMFCELSIVMEVLGNKWIKTIMATSLCLGLQFLTACGSDHKANIEDTPGGLQLLQQEFAECTSEAVDLNPPVYVRKASDFDQNPNLYPHQYPSLGAMYPQRGSFRQSKDEIMDIVDRSLWSPELGRGVKLLHYFDMVLLLNVASRSSSDPENRSAQRMQILVRESGSTDNLSTWKRVQVWPISTGVPCQTAGGEKIGTYTGVFKLDPSRMYSDYKSAYWGDADMYETMFLYHKYLDGTPTGVAIHGTYKTTALGRRDSGGCIRLYRDNVQCLYQTIEGQRNDQCLGGGSHDYRGRVPSFNPRFGEADPEYLSSGGLEVNGKKVLVAIFNEKNDVL